MDERDAAFADRLDDAWDAVVRSVPPNDGLAEQLQRLHALASAQPTDQAFLVQLRSTLVGERPKPIVAANGRLSLPIGSTASAPATPARRGVAQHLAAAVLVLGVLGGYLLFTGQRAADQEAASRLFLVQDRGRQVQELDPQTLSPLSSTPVALPVPPRWTGDLDVVGHWQVSADGSTMVTVESPADFQVDESGSDIAIVVRDWPDGAERDRFHPPAESAGLVQISANGERLLFTRAAMPWAYPPGPTLPDPQEWHVFDWRQQRLTTISSRERGTSWGGAQSAWLSPDGAKVLRLIRAGDGDAEGPSPTQLVVNDASTGAELGRVDLSELEAGFWTTDLTIDGVRLEARWEPGGAFSPDGRTLALVHPNRDAVTLVDVERLTVERTIAIESRQAEATPYPPATSEPREAWSLLPLEESAIARFAADGASLYVSGYEDDVDARGNRSCRDVPLRRVDLDSGAVIAEVDADLPLVALDGENLYSMESVLSPGACTWDPESTTKVLRRMDADTLATLAERYYPKAYWMELNPRIGGSIYP